MVQAGAVAQPVLVRPEEEARWNEPRWYALYTRSRHEKIVDRELQKKGIETFLPLRQIMSQWSDRKKMIEQPLFSSYLFVKFPLKERWTILNTTGAVSLVGKSAASPHEVPYTELQAIQKFVTEKIQIDPFPYLKEGQRVYVRTGPFKGVEGFIVRKDNHCRLVVSLDLLMQSISIVIDQMNVEAC